MVAVVVVVVVVVALVMVLIGTLLYIVDSFERHSELAEEMYMALRPIPKENSLCRGRFYKLSK